MAINKIGSKRKNHKGDKPQKPKSKSYSKKVWLIGVVIAIISVVVAIFVIVFKNQPSKLSNAYNTCKEKFAEVDAEVEEIKNKKDYVTIYLKSDTSEETLKSLARIMSSLGEVKNVEISTSEEEYQKFLDEYKNDEEMTKVLADGEMKELMRSSMDAVIRVEPYNSNDLSTIENAVNRNSEFRKYIDSKNEPTYSISPDINFGTLELLDDGKTIMMEIRKGEFGDKIGCICSTLNMPDRIKDAIGQTVATDGTRQDEWDSLKIEWSYRNDKLHIVIYQK